MTLRGVVNGVDGTGSGPGGEGIGVLIRYAFGDGSGGGFNAGDDLAQPRASA
jgi:hypothetical protein